MHKKHDPAFRFPELLVDDPAISPYAKQLALTMFGLADRQTGLLCRSQRYLSIVSGMSLDAVNKRLKELGDAGYITVKRRQARFNRDKGHPTGQASVYSCVVPDKGYLLIPYRLLRRLRFLHIHGAQISVFLCIYRLLRMNRAYPSRAMIGRITGLSDSTISKALSALDRLSILYIERCRKRNGAFSCNSYFLLQTLPADSRPERSAAAVDQLAMDCDNDPSRGRVQPTTSQELERTAQPMNTMIPIGGYPLAVSTDNPTVELFAMKLKVFISIFADPAEESDLQYYTGRAESMIDVLYDLQAISRAQLEDASNALWVLKRSIMAQQHQRPEGLPEDMAWSSAPYAGEEIDTYVYTGDMTPHDFMLMQEQRFVHSASADSRSGTLQQ